MVPNEIGFNFSGMFFVLFLLRLLDNFGFAHEQTKEYQIRGSYMRFLLALVLLYTFMYNFACWS